MGYKKTGYMKEDQEKIRVRKSAAKRLSSTNKRLHSTFES